MAKELVELRAVSIAKSCEVVSISQCCYRYESVNGTENEQLGDLLVSMINDPFKRRWGFGLCFDFIRNVLGYKWNHKRVYRIYCELELNQRIMVIPEVSDSHSGKFRTPRSPLFKSS